MKNFTLMRKKLNHCGKTFITNRNMELQVIKTLKRLVKGLVRRIVIWLEGIYARKTKHDLTNDELLDAISGLTTIEAAIHAIRGSRPRFFVDIAEKDCIITLIQESFPTLKDEIVNEAEGICRHVFDLLGSGSVDLDRFIMLHGGREKCGYLPWHYDFKTRYKWDDKKYYKKIKIKFGKADIKVPWELSRFQHVAVLGQAYWLTGEEKYAREFVREVEDWIERNPPMFGVNWACTMDVAIRAANWVMGFYFFKDAQAVTDQFLIKFLKSLLNHGRHIMANLENRGVVNNHYLADLVGLLYLGICFPEFKEGRQWKELGIRELVNEMGRQVYEDGVDFEASTCYHRLALEFFFHAALLCRLNGVELPEQFNDRLRKMFEFVKHVLKPDGRVSQIGDNDNGRLHILGKREALDMTYLLSYAAIFFDEPGYKILEFGFAPETIWVLGNRSYECWLAMPGSSVKELESKAFPKGGFYVMRCKDSIYVLISCGPNGQDGSGGHGHNDKLSIELWVDGKDVIVDPGTYVYTQFPEWRNRFRSTSFHNTVVVDGKEQNPFKARELFSLANVSNPTCLLWQTTDEKDIFIGRHYGYRRIVGQVVHTRKAELKKKDNMLEIVDILEGCGEHCFEWNFILTPFYEDYIEILSNDVLLIKELAYFSPAYGLMLPTVKLKAIKRSKLPLKVSFVIMKKEDFLNK